MSQEARLVTSGKFKDLQRANIKFAVAMLLRNYQITDCINEANAPEPCLYSFP